MKSKPDEAHLRRLIQSYAHWTGRSLLPAGIPVARHCDFLHHWNQVVVSHDTAADHIFNYGNLAALSLLEMDAVSFVGMPSRLSAEVPNQAEREKALAAVQEMGFVDDYQGVRISAHGQRFRIDRSTLWNVIDDDGQYLGQAATFFEWTYLGTFLAGEGI